MAAIDVSNVLSKIKSIKAPRYKIFNGKRMKYEDYASLSEEKIKELEQEHELFSETWDTVFPLEGKEKNTNKLINIKSWDFSELDKKLNEINKQWLKELNPIKREILGVKYFLTLEDWFKDCPEKIIELKEKLNELENLLK